MSTKRIRRKKGCFRLLWMILLLIIGWRLLTGGIQLVKYLTLSAGNDTIPLYLQTDRQWASKPYGDGTMSENGCGPTCLSMVYCGLTGDEYWNPYVLACHAEKEGYYVFGSGTAWSMMTELAQELGLTVLDVPFSQQGIKEILQEGSPIICSMGPGDFTTTGHFIVLTGITNDGGIIIRDPNSRKNSKKIWQLDQLMPQIKNLWGYDY